jgi:hypothetical protein
MLLLSLFQSIPIPPSVYGTIAAGFLMLAAHNCLVSYKLYFDQKWQNIKLIPGNVVMSGKQNLFGSGSSRLGTLTK